MPGMRHPPSFPIRRVAVLLSAGEGSCEAASTVCCEVQTACALWPCGQPRTMLASWAYGAIYRSSTDAPTHRRTRRSARLVQHPTIRHRRQPQAVVARLNEQNNLLGPYA